MENKFAELDSFFNNQSNNKTTRLANFIKILSGLLDNYKFEDLIQYIDENYYEEICNLLKWPKERGIDNIAESIAEFYNKLNYVKEENKYLIRNIIDKIGPILIEPLCSCLATNNLVSINEGALKALELYGEEATQKISDFLRINIEIFRDYELENFYFSLQMLIKYLDLENFLSYLDNLHPLQEKLFDHDKAKLNLIIKPLMKGMEHRNKNTPSLNWIYIASKSIIKKLGGNLLEALSTEVYDFWEEKLNPDVEYLRCAHDEAIDGLSIILNIPENFIRKIVVELVKNENDLVTLFYAGTGELSFDPSLESLNSIVDKLFIYVQKRIEDEIALDLQTQLKSIQNEYIKKIIKSIKFLNANINLNQINTLGDLLEHFQEGLAKYVEIENQGLNKKDLDIINELNKMLRPYGYELEEIKDEKQKYTFKYLVEDNRVVDITLGPPYDDFEFKAFPEAITELTHLKHLNFNGNNLKIIPESIIKLKNLEELNLSGTSLTKFPESITKLSSLKTLILRYNRLNQIPSSIDLLKALEVLDIGCNRVQALPDSIGNIQKLKRLRLNNNRIKMLPKTLRNLDLLEGLDLFDNDLICLPDSIRGCTSLKSLNIDENPLKEIPQFLSQMTTLKVIYLNETQLNLFPDELKEELKKNGVYLNLL